jgi:hypothetical protein
VSDLTCAIDGCDRPRCARGWCRLHYGRWHQTGDALGSLVPDHPDDLDLPGEHWLPIPGYEGLYAVSDLGRIRSLDRVITRRTDGRTQKVKGRVLRLSRSVKGRPIVILSASGQSRTRPVHRLVLLAFVGPCPPGLEACHNNGDRTDNRLSNLRFDTHSANILDRQRHGTDWQRNKVRCPSGHLLAAPNLVAAVVRRGRRNCLACGRARSSLGQARRRGETGFDFQATADAHYARIMTGQTGRHVLTR